MKLLHATSLLAVLSIVLGGCSKPADTPSGGGGGGGAETALQVQWPAGRKVAERLEVTQLSEAVFSQTPNPLTQEVVARVDYWMTPGETGTNGLKPVDLEFASVAVRAGMNGRESFRFDSAEAESKDPKNPVSAVLQHVPGKRFQLFLDGNNRVAKVAGLEEFNQALTNKTSAQARPVLNGLISEKVFKELAEYEWLLPRKPVRPGDRWPGQQDVALGSLGTLVLLTTNTFTGWEKRDQRRCALIEGAGVVAGKGTDGNAAPFGRGTTMQSGVTSFKVWFDPAAGVLVESRMERNMTVLMSLPSGLTNSPMQTITNHFKHSATRRLVRIEPGAR